MVIDYKYILFQNIYFCRYTTCFPPCPPYVGYSTFGSLTTCHLLKVKTSFCCLKLNKTCSHSSAKQASDYNWKTRTFIVAAEYPNLAMYNFIAPLRSVSIDKNKLNPIIFMFENEYIIRLFIIIYLFTHLFQLLKFY